MESWPLKERESSVTHTHTHTHMLTHIHSHTPTNTPKHTHTHTRIYTHAHLFTLRGSSERDYVNRHPGLLEAPGCTVPTTDATDTDDNSHGWHSRPRAQPAPGTAGPRHCGCSIHQHTAFTSFLQNISCPGTTTAFNWTDLFLSASLGARVCSARRPSHRSQPNNPGFSAQPCCARFCPRPRVSRSLVPAGQAPRLIRTAL